MHIPGIAIAILAGSFAWIAPAWSATVDFTTILPPNQFGTSPIIQSSGVTVTGSPGDLYFGPLGLGIQGDNIFDVDPGEHVIFTFDSLASGVSLSFGSSSGSLQIFMKGAPGTVPVQAIGVSPGNVNVSALNFNDPISYFAVSPLTGAFRINTVSFTIIPSAGPATSTPEPSTFALLALGAACLALTRARSGPFQS